MYSLNVPVPGRVKRIVADLRPALADFDDVRSRHTLVLKRLEDDDASFDRIAMRTRRALRGAPAVEARITGIDAFRDPVRGTDPVCYLAVESPGLHRIHRQLVDALGAIPELEGDEYVPHVTLGRVRSEATLERLLERSIDPVEWTVTELEFLDARRKERVGTVSLPA